MRTFDGYKLLLACDVFELLYILRGKDRLFSSDRQKLDKNVIANNSRRYKYGEGIVHKNLMASIGSKGQRYLNGE